MKKIKCPHCQEELTQDNIREERIQRDIYTLYLDDHNDLCSEFEETNYESIDNDTTYYCNECKATLDLTDEEVVEILKNN